MREFFLGLKHDHFVGEGNHSCWSSGSFGGRELVLSPLHVRRADCQQCAATEKAQPGVDLSLTIMQREMISAQLVGSVFDNFIDLRHISSEDNNAPFTHGDGIHYPGVMYLAELQLIMRGVIGEHDQDVTTTRSSSGGADTDTKDWKERYEEALAELQAIV